MVALSFMGEVQEGREASVMLGVWGRLLIRRMIGLLALVDYTLTLQLRYLVYNKFQYELYRNPVISVGVIWTGMSTFSAPPYNAPSMIWSEPCLSQNQIPDAQSKANDTNIPLPPEQISAWSISQSQMQSAPWATT